MRTPENTLLDNERRHATGLRSRIKRQLRAAKCPSDKQLHGTPNHELGEGAFQELKVMLYGGNV